MNYGNDIGSLGNNPGSTSNINYEPVKYTQVYWATHKDDGSRSSYMNRSFISFSFGGKLIEDFNLIACINGDRMNKQLYANFNDLTSEYDIIDGQFYWGTYFADNEINFTLSTDGITQNQLDDFKNWFAPGEIRELILSEHPNRAIMARVMEPPEMEVIPFEEETTVTINTIEYKTSTTVYKGDINLTLVMSEPFWYSKTNLLVQKNENENEYVDIWTNANDENVSVYKDKDALKIILEDGVPVLKMIKNSVFLGNNLFFTFNLANARVDYALVGSALANNNISAMSENIIGINLEPNNSVYLYYAGTAPEKPIISFNIDPNDLTNRNEITFKSINEQTLTFKRPIMYKEFDEASLIINRLVNSNPSEENKKEMIDAARKNGRDKLTHLHLRSWFFYILDCYEKGSEGFEINELNNWMNEFYPTEVDAEFVFNFQTGETKAYLPHKKIVGHQIDENSGTWINELTEAVDVAYTEYEDVSEILLSSPIIFKDRNHPNSQGIIQQQTNNDLGLSYKITHNLSGALKNLSITYKNKYY